MTDYFERFGTPDENIQAAARWVEKHQKKYAYHTHVPTRKEVATMPASELRELMVGWMVHSPTEIIPSRTQIALAREVLLCRPDAHELTALLDMCKHYIDGP